MPKTVRSALILSAAGAMAVVSLSLSPLPAFAAGLDPWMPVGPQAGRLYSATTHPALPGWLWLGWPGGLFRTLDRGAHWTWTGSPWGPFDAVTADPAVAGALWAANGSGFYRTEDGGSRWTLVARARFVGLLESGTSPQGIFAVPGSLYVFTYRRVLRSTDGGRTWTIRYNLDSLGANGWIEELGVDASAPGRLYLSMYGPERPALLQSLDSGLTWSELTSCPMPDAGLADLLVTAQGVYVGTRGDSPGLFRSTDAGASWQRLSVGGSAANFDTRSIVADPRRTRTMYLIGAVLDHEFPEVAFWISRNAGDTWTRLAEAPSGRLLVDAGGTLYALAGDLLQSSADRGVTWAPVFRAPSTESSFARLGFWETNPASLALTVGWTSYRSADAGRSWRLVNTPQGVRDLLVEPGDANHLIAATSSSVFLSGDSGRTWRKTTDRLWYVELLVRTDHRTLLAGGAGVYRSDDDGETWQTGLPGWAPGSDVGRWTQKIEADATRPDTVYALTFLIENLEPPHGVLADSPSALWKSTDAGRTWRKTAANFRTFAVDPVRSRVYGVRNRDLLQSDDAGSTWKRIATTPVLFHDLVLDPAAPGTLYAAGSGVWRSRDRGATWTQVATSWTPATLQLDSRAPRALFGADRWGVLKVTLPAQ